MKSIKIFKNFKKLKQYICYMLRDVPESQRASIVIAKLYKITVISRAVSEIEQSC